MYYENNPSTSRQDIEKNYRIYELFGQAVAMNKIGRFLARLDRTIGASEAEQIYSQLIDSGIAAGEIIASMEYVQKIDDMDYDMHIVLCPADLIDEGIKMTVSYIHALPVQELEDFKNRVGNWATVASAGQISGPTSG